MSMFLPQNKFSNKLSVPLLLACFAVTVVGCSRTEQKDGQNSSATSEQQQDAATVACNNEKATNAIHSYLVNRIEQQAKKQSDIIQQQAGTAVDMTILQNGLSQVAINLESVNGSNGKCQATVSFNMPQSQLDNADKIYTRLKLPVSAEQIKSRGYQLQNSTLVANKVGFGVSANGANYQVGSTSGDDVIELVGEIMANSALAQTLTQPSNMPMSGSTAVPVVVPPAATKSTVTSKTTETTSNHTVKKQPAPKPKDDSEKSTTKTTRTATNNTTTEVKTKITPAKTTAQSEAADKNTIKKAEAENKSTATKSTSATTTEKASKPVSHEKVPTDTNLKLNIEEKNEQY